MTIHTPIAANDTTPTLADLTARLREMNNAVEAYNAFHRAHPIEDEMSDIEKARAERLDIDRHIAVTAWECASAHAGFGEELSRALACQAVWR